MGYYNEFLFEDAITWTTDGANAGTVHFRKGKFYCTNVCGVLLNSYGYANRCIAEILGRVSKRYVSYVGNPKLMNNVMSEICIYIPSLAEQSHIDDFLVDSLKKYKRGVVSKVFSEIARKCNTIRLGDCVTISRGGSPRPIDSYITNDPDGINWIKIGDTSADELYITRTKEKIIPSGVKKSRKVFQGDLILSNSMSFGRPYILQIDGCIHDGWLLIRDESNVFEKRFLCYYLGSDNVFTQYKRFAAGSCVNNLNSELVGDVEICCPPRSIQQKVADMLAVLDSRIAHSSRIYEALQQMRTSLLQQLFI